MPSSRKSARERWQSLANTDAVAKQDVDQRTFTWNANIAQVKAAQANVDRLVAEEGFKRLIAPFDGVVTARETDIGALINVGAAGGARAVRGLRNGEAARLCQCAAKLCTQRAAGHQGHDQRAGTSRQDLQGTVEASAQAVDPNTGTTLMQLIVDNQRR